MHYYFVLAEKLFSFREARKHCYGNETSPYFPYESRQILLHFSLAPKELTHF